MCLSLSDGTVVRYCFILDSCCLSFTRMTPAQIIKTAFTVIHNPLEKYQKVKTVNDVDFGILLFYGEEKCIVVHNRWAILHLETRAILKTFDFEAQINLTGHDTVEKDTNYGNGIPVKERLSATLRHLATGVSHTSWTCLNFKFPVQPRVRGSSNNTILTISRPDQMSKTRRTTRVSRSIPDKRATRLVRVRGRTRSTPSPPSDVAARSARLAWNRLDERERVHGRTRNVHRSPQLAERRGPFPRAWVATTGSRVSPPLAVTRNPFVPAACP